ncbi:hypothetical protein VKT23_006508 [Stygiomarasmius scandens]|uniref:Uncharacterized protein n=1 Tax=Marasmiellus scandens TaxID=2682957 RepID=A0ABR1JSD0_9AGAR
MSLQETNPHYFSRKLADDLTSFLQNYSVPSFLSSANSDLPLGVFIATNMVAIVDLAEFLEKDANKDLKVTHLLLSDSSSDDLIHDRGFIDTKVFADGKRTADDIDVSDEEEDARCYNRKLLRRYRRLRRDHSAVISRILERTSSSLERLSYLVYTENWMEEEELDTLLQSSPSYPHYENNESAELSELFTLEFPVLRELSLRNKILWRGEARFPWADSLDASTCVFPHLPSLTHLHVSGSSYHIKGIPTLATLNEHLPSLTQVRFSATGVPKELHKRPKPYQGWTREKWQQTRDWWSPPPPEPSPIPPGLTFLYNPRFPDLDIGFCGTSAVEFDDFLVRLGRLASDFRSGFHLIWPSEEDFQKYGRNNGTFPPDRAVKNFRDCLTVRESGERDVTERGEWKEPEGRPWELDRREWWWNPYAQQSKKELQLPM